MFFNTILSRKKENSQRSVFDGPNDPTIIVSFEGIRQQIRELAYKKWEEAGQPEGQDEEFWVRAERDLFGDEPLVDGGYRIRMDDGEYVLVRPT